MHETEASILMILFYPHEMKDLKDLRLKPLVLEEKTKVTRGLGRVIWVTSRRNCFPDTLRQELWSVGDVPPLQDILILIPGN